MGTAAAARAGHIVLTDDNPRDEDPSAIVADIRAGIGAGHSVQIEHARERAITGAIESARPGDVVVIAGKGHETQQQTGDSYRELSDREIVRDVLEGLS
jgi:UDP-N-acetylmuramyl tripeptide synthase